MATGVSRVGGLRTEVGLNLGRAVGNRQEADIVPANGLQVAVIDNVVAESTVGEGLNRVDVGSLQIVALGSLPVEHVGLAQVVAHAIIVAIDLCIGVHFLGEHRDVNTAIRGGLVAKHGEEQAGAVVLARSRGQLEVVRSAEEEAVDSTQVVRESRLEDRHVELLDVLGARVAVVCLARDARRAIGGALAGIAVKAEANIRGVDFSSGVFDSLSDIGAIHSLANDEIQEHGKDEQEENLSDNARSFSPNRLTSTGLPNVVVNADNQPTDVGLELPEQEQDDDK